MEYNNLLELIKTVSDSNISNFEYEEGNMKILMSSGEVTVDDSEKVIPTIKSIQVEEKPIQNEISGNIIKSPLVGTFYAAPAEDAQPFVNVGDVVSKGQVLAIVEAMKLMNDIESDYDGVVTEVYVQNGESVEFGQPLFAIK